MRFELRAGLVENAVENIRVAEPFGVNSGKTGQGHIHQHAGTPGSQKIALYDSWRAVQMKGQVDLSTAG